MLIRHIRGTVITFTATFADAAGVEVTPSSATMHLNYMNEGVRVDEDLDMEMNTDGQWVTSWDSFMADAGRVYWHTRSDNPRSAQDGYFELVANLANPDTETA